MALGPCRVSRYYMIHWKESLHYLRAMDLSLRAFHASDRASEFKACMWDFAGGQGRSNPMDKVSGLVWERFIPKLIL